ncbi:MAG: heme-degrading domain-containing protein [Acidobacteriaceae bacterium]
MSTPTPDPAQDLAIIAQQEALLHFTTFTPETAWQLGNRLRSALLYRVAGGTVEIELAGHLLFACTTPGATPGQSDWVRRKRNTVRRFARSSYAIGRQLELDGQTIEARHGLSLTDYAAHGGGFPLVLAGSGCVGTIIVSGLPQRDDHNLVVASIAEHLGVDIPTLP